VSKILTRSLRNLTMSACHYVGLRLYFRAVVLTSRPDARL